ncbi:hypothetical protein KDE12_01465 [Campylobacter sp. faydin G-105]|uniref:hypothetical protein n=1 Tax=Campylobacter anatolicus TaxID=2829105 RepID=UPI001B9EDD93|nr:hypothetical protein [Campylobacter anatolicus]MBR8461521.1 hypothetical protein [Campylobacter anatolicus]
MMCVSFEDMCEVFKKAEKSDLRYLFHIKPRKPKEQIISEQNAKLSEYWSKQEYLPPQKAILLRVKSNLTKHAEFLNQKEESIRDCVKMILSTKRIDTIHAIAKKILKELE